MKPKTTGPKGPTKTTGPKGPAKTDKTDKTELGYEVPPIFNVPAARALRKVARPGSKRARLYPVLLAGVKVGGKGYPGLIRAGLDAGLKAESLNRSPKLMLEAMGIAHREYGYGFRHDTTTDTLTMVEPDS